MLRILIAAGAALVLVGCASTKGGDGGNGGDQSANQSISNSTINGNNTNSIGNNVGGSAGDSGDATLSLDLKLALDSEAFAAMFSGAVPPITNPKPAQIDTLAANAEKAGVTMDQVNACRANPVECRIGVK